MNDIDPLLWDMKHGGRPAMLGLGDALRVAIEEAKNAGAMEEAAKHADCCVDREERDALKTALRQAVLALRDRRKKGPHLRNDTPPMPARDGDKLQARRRVATLFRTGRLPHPNSLPCVNCGHVWVVDGPRHEYDHYLGYAAAHHFDVQVVCMPCHRRLAVVRRELVGKPGALNPHARLSAEQVSEIRRRSAAGEAARALARAFGVGAGTVQNILKGRTWRNVG